MNVAGGIKIEEPAIDLAVCASLVSGLHDAPISDKTAFAAEVGLGGEVRAVNRIDNRISEAEKLGFTEIFISKYNMKGLDPKKYEIKIRPFSRLTDVFENLLS